MPGIEKGARRDKRTRQDKERLIERWLEVRNEVPQAEFARGYGINVEQFNKWVAAYRRARGIKA
jgi:transposase-like protein